MAITGSWGYDGSLSELPFSKMWELMGKTPVVVGSGDWAVTAISGGVRIAAGAGAAVGVYDESTSTDVTLPAVTGSPKWYTVVCHRDWSGTAGTTTFKAVLGGTTQAVAAGVQKSRGIAYDQVLALARVSPGLLTPDGGTVGTPPIDLRVPLATAQAGQQIVASLKRKVGTQHINANSIGLVWENLAVFVDEVTIGSGWGYSSGTFTVPITGLYDISAQVFYPAGTSGSVGIRWVQEGTVVASDLHGNDGAPGGLNAATTCYANAGDRFTIQAWSTNAAGQDMGVSGSGNPARFSLKCVAANPALLSS